MRPLDSESAHRSSGELIGVVGPLTGDASLPSRGITPLRLSSICWRSCRKSGRRGTFGPALCPLCSARSWLEGQGVTVGWDHPERCQALFFPPSALGRCVCPIGHVHFSRRETGKDRWDNAILSEVPLCVLVCNILARCSIFWRRGDI